MTAATKREDFVSDNAAPLCPEAISAIVRANEGCATPYGDDAITARAVAALSGLFGRKLEAWFVTTGTAANCLPMAQCLSTYGAIVCADEAHLIVDETGAPGFFAHGASVLPLPGRDGKIDPQRLERLLSRAPRVHDPKFEVLSFAQTTELGTVYRPGEIAALCEIAHRHGLAVHMDGARFANACAALGVAPAALSVDLGVDILSFGGTKNGLGLAEAVIFFEGPGLLEFGRRLKQSGHMPSKGRYFSAPWIDCLEKGAWLDNARRANEACALLERRALAVPGIELAHPREANALFVRMPRALALELNERGWAFYEHGGEGVWRLMTAWNTEAELIERFAAELALAARRLAS